MITLSASGGSVTFEFSGNSTYLNDGTITVPVNSLALIVDESDMVTFRKSASSDIFVSANIAEFGMTKDELMAWYKANMVGSTGGGGGVTPEEVEEMIDEAISGITVSGVTEEELNEAIASAKTEIEAEIPTVPTSNTAFTNDAGYATSGYVDSSVSGYADSCIYDDNAKAVKFYHGGTGGTEVYSFDASPFLVDGMIDDVRIETISGVTYLVIDFNTASGKEDIQIPLTDIFDPSNYYDKTEIDAIVSGKADTTAVTEEISAAVSGKTNESDFSAHTANTIIHVTSSQTAYWDAKSNFSGSYNDLTDKPTIPTVPTSNTAFTNDAGYITEDALSGYAESSAVTEEISAAVSGKADSSAVTEVSDALTAHTANTTVHITAAERTAWNAKSDFSGSYNDLTDKPTIPTVPTSNTAFTNDAGYITSGEAQTQIDNSISGKVDASTYTAYTAATDAALSGKADTATTYTKTEVDNAITAATSTKQDTLIAGDNITISGNVISATGGGGGGMTEDMERLISTALVDLNDRKIDASEVKSNYQKKGDYATKSALDLKANASEVMTLDKSKENELVTATALNSINERLIALEAAVQALQALHNNG